AVVKLFFRSTASRVTSAVSDGIRLRKCIATPLHMMKTHASVIFYAVETSALQGQSRETLA
ncbi:hypothetical protein ACCT20_37995, partial [Rhizobium ruizarguesonis]